MKIRMELISREIGGEFFLVPVGSAVRDANGLFALNELGQFIWERLPEAECVDDILEKVLEEYEVDEAQARLDIEAFLNKLESLKIL